MENRVKKSAEFSARTIEQAIEQGVSALGISRMDAEIEVVKSGSRGVLGIGAEDALVRLTYWQELEAEEVAEEPAPVEMAHEDIAEEPGDEGPENELATAAIQVLEELLAHMGVSARVEVADEPSALDDDEDVISLNVSGDDLGVLIGRRGETLRDLQFITRLVVSRRIQSWPNIVIDVEYYRARRERLLMDLAKRMADRVRISRQSIALEPMPAHERRIVHLALRDDPNVMTESTGDGQERKVVIIPKP